VEKVIADPIYGFKPVTLLNGISYIVLIVRYACCNLFEFVNWTLNKHTNLHVSISAPAILPSGPK
jgi:hypothetical protein